MKDEDSIWPLFDSVIDDSIEKKILKLIVEGKTSEAIVKELLEYKDTSE